MVSYYQARNGVSQGNLGCRGGVGGMPLSIDNVECLLLVSPLSAAGDAAAVNPNKYSEYS